MVSNDEIKRRLKQKRAGHESGTSAKNNLEQIPSKDNVCPECNQTNNPSARFCIDCGSDLINKAEADSPESVLKIPSQESVEEEETSYLRPETDGTRQPDIFGSECPQCGSGNDVDAGFCVLCGAELKEDDKFDDENKTEDRTPDSPEIILKPKSMPDTIHSADSLKCPHCGTENGNKSDFCIECGSSLKNDSLNKVKKKKNDTSGFFGPEKKGIEKGVTGGVAMMGISVLWFFGGLVFLDRIFFYPFILFAIGIYACIKGLVK